MAATAAWALAVACCTAAAALAVVGAGDGRTPLPALAAAAAAFAALIAYHWRHALGAHRPPAGAIVVPGALPLIGNAHQLLPNLPRLHEWLLGFSRGPAPGRATFWYTVPFMRAYVCILRPDIVEWVLRVNADNYPKGPPFRENLGVLLGTGIFVSDGDHWRWQRKLAARIFSVARFRRAVGEAFAAKARQLEARLAAAAAAGADDSSCARGVDAQDLFFRFTLDTFSRIGFGADPGSLAAEGPIPFAVAFDRAQRITNERFYFPAWRLLEALDGRARQLRQDAATVRAFAADIIAARRAELAAAAEGAPAAPARCGTPTAAAAGCDKGCGGLGDAEDGPEDGAGSPPSAASSVSAGSPRCTPLGPKLAGPEAAGRGPKGSGSLQSANGGGGGSGLGEAGEAADLLTLFMREAGPGGAPLGEEELVDAVLNFIIAGRDTTAQALSWTLYEVLRRPDVEARLLAEAEAVLGPARAGGGANPGVGGGEGGAPGYDQCRELKYARAVFLEGLRLHPSVPQDCKCALRADTLPDGTRVPAGALVQYSIYSINRAREFWGPDADEFRPERWLEFKHPPPAYVALSFNAGPRACLGQRLAELEGTYVLVTVLRRFALSLVPGQAVTYDLSTTLPIKGGLWVRVAERGAPPAAAA